MRSSTRSKMNAPSVGRANANADLAGTNSTKTSRGSGQRRRPRQSRNEREPKSALFFFRQRSRTGGRRPLAGAYVLGPAPRVIFGCHRFQVAFGLRVNLLEKRNAPAAAGPRPAALGELAGYLRLSLPREVHQLAARHVEAITDFGVEVHQRFLISWARFLFRGFSLLAADHD